MKGFKFDSAQCFSRWFLLGLFDSLNKTVSGVNSAMNSAQQAARTAQRAKGMADKAGKMLEKKCRVCNQQPLKTDLEKQKGMCANCALKQMK